MAHHNLQHLKVMHDRAINAAVVAQEIFLEADDATGDASNEFQIYHTKLERLLKTCVDLKAALASDGTGTGVA